MHAAVRQAVRCHCVTHRYSRHQPATIECKQNGCSFCFVPLQGTRSETLHSDRPHAQAQTRHPARSPRAHPRRRRGLLRARRLSPHDHAGHLQGGADQPRRALRLLQLEGRPDRRPRRARPLRLCRALRRPVGSDRPHAVAVGARQPLLRRGARPQAHDVPRDRTGIDAQSEGRGDLSLGRPLRARTASRSCSPRCKRKAASLPTSTFRR